MSFTALDCIFFIVVLFFALLASIRGFINEIMGKMAMVLAIGVAVLFYQKLAHEIVWLIPHKGLGAIAAFIMLFVITFLAVKIVQLILSKIFSGALLGSLNHALGLLFGCVEGLVVVLIILYVLCRQPFFDVQGIVKGSQFLHWFAPFIADPEGTVRGIIA
ncbi:MAG: CvpA family protein [Treponema sp.]|nr:CvpA family protein [Treponema sp.]